MSFVTDLQFFLSSCFDIESFLVCLPHYYEKHVFFKKKQDFLFIILVVVVFLPFFLSDCGL